MEPSQNSTQIDDDEQLELFKKLDSYPWDGDEDFQAGLQAILGSQPSTEQAQELNLRAKCFYYSRKHGVPVDFDSYKSWTERLSENDSQPRSGHGGTEALPEASAPYPASFAEIVELITSGKPVPGIRDVPDIILKGQSTPSITATRKKPWEVGIGNNENISKSSLNDKAEGNAKMGQ